ncbi:hypothetical protein LTR70_005798 [Exophiala xenobiotica]|uniref:Uncharacterized protein n=1 Tax=Lithohypha guttulata TaxID=1690604 RepID=A0ABR0JZ73_9EURO|nr:hypothetical protein LTR24_008825 [Lithohypha guttulata]KAK5317603.1 hypothetical protein LTR70_005798 [Exophiala xenobiotica]
MYISSGHAYYIAADLQCAGDKTRTELIQLGFNIVEGTSFIPWDVNIEGTSSEFIFEILPVQLYDGSTPVPGPLLNESQKSIIPPHCIYEVKLGSATAITKFFSDVLNASSIYYPFYVNTGYEETQRFVPYITTQQ